MEANPRLEGGGEGLNIGKVFVDEECECRWRVERRADREGEPGNSRCRRACRRVNALTQRSSHSCSSSHSLS